MDSARLGEFTVHPAATARLDDDVDVLVVATKATVLDPALERVTGQLAPEAPQDVFAALGFGGQVLLVDPTTRTMVVRIGAPAQPGAESYGFGKAAAVLTAAAR